MTSSGFVSLGRVKASDEFKSKLFKYALEGKARKIELLFANNPGSSCDIDSCNTRGQSSLFVACMSGHHKCATTLLLRFGANPNRRSDDGSTACHAASFSCNTLLLQSLVDNGGDLRLHDNRDLMPRDWAVEAGARKNKKMLELIDTWQEQTTKTILSSNYSGKLTTSCSTKSLGANSKPPNIATTATSNQRLKQTGFLNGSFGDFVAMDAITESSVSSSRRHAIGYKSIIPVVNSQHLNCIENEPTASYNIPPYFTLSSAKWGNQNVTVKRVRKMKRKPAWQHASTTDLLIAEQKTHSLLRHNHILLLMGICFEGDKNAEDSDSLARFKNTLLPQQLVYERVELGTLYHLLHEKKFSFPIYDAVSFLIQSANALSYLHQRGLIHCCVTSHALYIVDHSTAKLSDLYYTFHSEEKAGIPNRLSSAFNRWLSPEILAEKKPSFESDTYSFCVLMCEFLSGVLPWKGFDPDSIRHQIVSKGRVMNIPESIPDQFYAILSKGLSISRRKRTYNIESISYQLQQFLKSDNILQANSTIKSTQGTPLRSHDTLLSERSCFKHYGDLPDAAPYTHQNITEPDNSHIIDRNYIKVTPIRGNTTALVPSGLQNKLESSFTSKPPIPVAAVRNILTEQSFHQPENSIKNSTLSSVKVSVHNGPVQQRTPNSQNRSLMMERFLNDETDKLSHSLDEDLVGVHPDLMDTDSRDSSLNGEVQQSLVSLCNNSEPQLYPVTPTYHPLAKERSIKVATRTPSGGNRENTSERSSPYPDLSERRNSPGEYVLSGLSPEHGESLQCVLDEDKSTMSFASSYLAQVYKNENLKKKSASLIKFSPNKNNFVKKAIEPDTNISTITENTEINDEDRKTPENAKSNDENLHNSVDKVYNSFVELSRMITPRSDDENMEKSLKQEENERGRSINDQKLEGREKVVIEKERKHQNTGLKNILNTGLETYIKEYRADDNKILDDDSLLHSNTEDFFNEVISAAGIDYLGKGSDKHVGNSEPRAQKKKSMEDIRKLQKNKSTAEKSETPAQREKGRQRKTAEIKPKGKKAKARAQRKEKGKFPAVEMKSEVLDMSSSDKQRPRKKHQRELEKRNLSASTGKVEVLFSNFPSNPSRKSKKKSKVDDIVDQMSREIDPEFEDPALDAELEELMEESRGLVSKATRATARSVPFPSGSVGPRKKSQSPDMAELFGQFANRNSEKERRFSMTSNDLENVFADFANRKNHLCTDQDTAGIDMVDGPVVNSTSEAIRQQHTADKIKNGEEKIQVTRASQTSDVDIAGQCDKFSQTDSNKARPKNPPQISSFIRNAKSKSSEPGVLLQCSISSQTKNPEDLNQQLESGIENLNRPFDILSSQINSAPRVSKKQERAIVPASHLQPVSSHASMRSHNALSATSSQTSPRYIQTDRDLQSYQQITAKNKYLEKLDDAGYQSPVGSGCPSDSGKSMDKTPSKWSFHRKVSIFEAKTSENQVTDASNQVADSFLRTAERKPRREQIVDDSTSDHSSSSETGVDLSKNEAKSTQTCENASGDSHSIMYTTALEGVDQQTRGTPVNLPRIRTLINTEKTKTSTPVYHKPFLFNEATEKIPEVQNLDESYGKNPPRDDPRKSSNKKPQNEINFAPGLLNLDQSSFAMNSSSFLQMSMIPRSVNLPDVSTESNATFGEENHPASKQKKGPGSEKNPVENKRLDCELAPRTEPGNTNQSSSDMNSALSIGIGQLSTMLADEVIDKERKILMHEKMAEGTVDLSVNFSGISYDESPDNEDLKLKEKEKESMKSTNEKPVNDCDTSVWAESQVSNQVQEQCYQMSERDENMVDRYSPHDGATNIIRDPRSWDAESYDEEFEVDIEEEESSSGESGEYSDEEN